MNKFFYFFINKLLILTPFVIFTHPSPPPVKGLSALPGPGPSPAALLGSRLHHNFPAQPDSDSDTPQGSARNGPGLPQFSMGLARNQPSGSAIQIPLLRRGVHPARAPLNRVRPRYLRGAAKQRLTRPQVPDPHPLDPVIRQAPARQPRSVIPRHVP